MIKHLLLIILCLLSFSLYSQESQYLAFLSNRSGNHDIYLIKEDGTGLSQITNTPYTEMDLAWSPDGTKLLYSANPDGDFQLYYSEIIDFKNVKFSKGKLLTDKINMALSASWFKDESMIVCMGEYQGIFGIYIYHIASDRVEKIHTNGVEALHADFSPVNNKIVLGSHEGLYNFDYETSTITELSDEYSIKPKWSPDGKKIVVVQIEAGEDIFILNADGSGRKRLTDNPGNDFLPSWSPDGNRIAYQLSIGSRDDIAVIDTTGNLLHKLTDTGNNTCPIYYRDYTNNTGKKTAKPRNCNNFKVYPNPVIDKIYLKLNIPGPEEFYLDIIPLIGKNQTVKKIKLGSNHDESPHEISFKNMQSGIYLLNLVYNNRNVNSIKVIKQ